MPAPDRLLAFRAAYEFANRFPDRSAMRPSQKGAVHPFNKPMLMAGLFGLAWPEMLLQGLIGIGFVFFCVSTAFRIGLVLASRWMGSSPHSSTREKMEWPIYTVLIALKDEAAIIPQLSAAIAALDYPPEKLDLKLLIEQGDKATRRALMEAVWPAATEVLVLPPGAPQTKPRALNYGLLRARGACVVVYDAEDVPHPNQLKAAARAFATGEGEIVCLQAPLIGRTSRPSWVARQWALEYAVQFQRVMVGLTRLGLPVALGGTSNHFRIDALRSLCGWDAWNVTEDADLGLRLSRSGYSVGVLAEPTFERPPERMGIWLGQRSRWLKGYMQTWGVLMRSPPATINELGWVPFLAVQLTLGAAILAALVHGPWALWCAICLLWPGMSLGPFATCMFGLSIASGWLMAALSKEPRSSFGWWEVASQPFYWPLQSIAMARAVYGLIACPHFWAKTPH